MHGTQIRLRSIESFNKEYQTNYKLKPKLKGRNKDYHITEMDNYQQMKNNIEIHQRNLKLIEEKNNNLSNKTKEIEEILDNLKSKGFIKSELVLKVVDRDKMIAFIHLIDRTIAEYQSVAELTTTLKEVETELLNNRDRLKLLEQDNDDLSLKVDSLTKNIKEKDKYVQLTHDLYEHRGLDEDDYKELINFSKPINSSRDYIAKEKDDYER